ncbi:transposase [Anaerosalibacter massiliensis]|uniref:transposase n=1 Tax=Anaerosalibacter massiliensis TaxID=1347392 RepID=UPI003B84A098
MIKDEGLCYGYYKITILLRRKFNLIINKKKVYRLCKKLNILRPQRKIKPKHPRRIAINREITTSNSLWEVDVKYGYINGEDRFFYIAYFIDIYDRSIVDYHIGLSCKTENIIITLKRALMRRNLNNKKIELVIRSDNGSQFISNKFQDTCENLHF